MTPLFFQKVAEVPSGTFIKLPDDTNQWAPLIVNQLLKQCPFLNTFVPQVDMSKIDPHKGIAFGSIKLSSTASPEISISVPVVVRDWNLSPFDIFFNKEGRGFSLSEERVSEYLMSPQTFGGMKVDRGIYDYSLKQMMTPPWEDVGGGLRSSNSNVYEKQSMLLNLNGTVDEGDVTKLASWINSTEGRVYLNTTPNPEMFLAGVKLAGRDTSYTKEYPERYIVQFSKHGDNYTMKVANPDNFTNPAAQPVSAQDAQAAMPAGNAQELAAQGTTTMQEPANSVPQVPQTLATSTYKEVDTFGLYRTISVAGEHNVGWVFPQLFDYEMNPLPLKMFADGRHYVLQENIIGIPVGQSNSLPAGKIQGMGFFHLSKNGGVTTFAPVIIRGSSIDETGSELYMCEGVITGNKFNISLVPGLVAAAKYDEDTYAIPADSQFMPLGEPLNPLMADPMQAQQVTAEATKKMASGQLITGRVTIDGSISLEGPALGGVDSQFLKLAEAEFLLACVGVPPASVRSKVASAKRTGGLINFVAGNRIIPAGMNKVAKKETHRNAFIETIKVSMFKEAADISKYDPSTADALLSLNFLSPENLQKFIAYMPKLEDAVDSLANLLLASRLGLADIPEGSCASALSATEKVLSGLRQIQLREGAI